MNEEERQRQMDFIINTLANLSAKIDGLVVATNSLTNAQTKSKKERRADTVRLARLEEAFVVVSRLSQRYDERLDEHQARISNVENAIVILTRLVNEGHNGQA
ncbi:MAG: hypothetical protein QOD00_3625 [Blastocatellia bacterium]|jgi:hypothetical protein|nr:hypothetical protein [Blastocatellia bacterium]